MKRKFSIKRIVFLIFILSIVTIGGCFFQIRYNPYKNIPRESEELPTYVAYESVYIGTEKIYLGSIEEVFDVQEVFCVNGEKIYFVHSKDNGNSLNWYLASYDINTEEYKTYYELSGYQKDLSKIYRLQNGYCKEQKIVLNDQNIVVEFDTSSQEIQTFQYEEYEFPKLDIYGENINGNSIQVVMDSKTNIWTLEKMAEKSKSIETLCSFKTKMNWDGETYLPYFFEETSVQCFDEKVYAVGEAINYHGAAFAIILEYNVEDDVWEYVTSHRTGGTSHGNVYIVPHY